MINNINADDTKSCRHISILIDEHNGTFVCSECGHVKSSHLFTDEYYLTNKNDIVECATLGEVENFLHQLHIPSHLSHVVNNNLMSKKSQSIHSQKNKTSNIKKIASEIYNSVNENNSCILLKDIANFSQLRPDQIKSKNVLIVDIMNIVEKYTTKFGLNFKECLIIKKELSQFNNTGYQPLTIIAGLIYLYLIKSKKKLPMLKIANILGISSISIQRFIKKYKNALSPRY